MGEGNLARRGRPRSERARQAVLDATRSLLTDDGLPGVTVDQIAARAGVSKNTIYRWWPSKAAILMDAFTSATSAKLASPTDGAALQRFRGQVHRAASLMSEPAARRPFVALVAASQHDPDLADALRTRFIAGRRQAAKQLLIQVGAESEPRRPDEADPDTIIDLVYGALYYRLLISQEPLNAHYVDQILDAALGRDRGPDM